MTDPLGSKTRYYTNLPNPGSGDPGRPATAGRFVETVYSGGRFGLGREMLVLADRGTDRDGMHG